MVVSTLAQNDSIPQDSLKFSIKYGLRVGVDLSKLVKTVIDDDYTGFEINADYRIKPDMYIAGELGFEEKTTLNDYLNSTSSGSYLKAGVGRGVRPCVGQRPPCLRNGFRVGYSTFSESVNSYTIYTTDQTWNQYLVEESIDHDGLSGIWGELIVGIKAEVFSNLFMGLNAQLKFIASETEPDNFENLFIPGFGRTYDSGSFGIGFGYNISYLIPLYKKDK